jgi:hypothetical protein
LKYRVGLVSTKAIDAFIWFEDDITVANGGLGVGHRPKEGDFEIKDWSFEVVNPSTIGSATTGAGSGKAEFGEFTIGNGANPASSSAPCVWCPR